MSIDKQLWIAPSATPWDDIPESDLKPAELLVKACHDDIYRYRHVAPDLSGEADFFNACNRNACPEWIDSTILLW